MTIPNHAKRNFHTLLRAAADGNLALMECLDTRTSEPRYVLCAVGHDGTDQVFTPFGHLGSGVGGCKRDWFHMTPYHTPIVCGGVHLTA